MRPIAPAVGAITAPLLAAAVLVACAPAETGVAPPQPATTGTPERGARLIADYGCSTCHVVPGVAEADGLVGPPLTSFGRRSYIAGELPNNEENLQRWIRSPQAVEPGTAMPDLGVTARDAADITAYLSTLR
jgi:cytochrome c